MSDPEQESSIMLTLGDGRDFEANVTNTTLYTYLGRTVIGDVIIENESVNHVFLDTSEGTDDERVTSGCYVFHEFNPLYVRLAKMAVAHRFPMILNSRTVPPCDMTAYVRELDKATATFAAQIPDSIDEK